MINRSLQPEIQDLDNLTVPLPRRTTLSNGIPLAIIDAGEQDVVRMDILFAGGRWQQAHKLQALFTNRMLREGSRKYTAADIAENWITMEHGWSCRALPSMPISPCIP